MGVACATGPAYWYSGPAHPRDDDAVLSPSGGDLQRHFTVVIIALDGRPLEASSTSELRIAPGPHAFRARVKFRQYATGWAQTWMEAEVHASFEARRGHTYLPDAVVAGSGVFGNVADMGVDYPATCLPSQRAGIARLLPPTAEINDGCLARR